MSHALYRRTTQLMEANVGGDLVGLDMEQGDCFGFNEVAARVWESLSEPKSFDQLCDQLFAEYRVDREECGRDLRELLAQLVKEGLVEEQSDDPTQSASGKSAARK